MNAAQALDALKQAQAYYRSWVRKSWVFGYLFSRNLADQLAPAQIGYSPRGKTKVTEHLRGLGFSDETLVEAGISRKDQEGNIVDALRDRLMMPICNTQGQVVGWTGRAAPDAPEHYPKYQNTATTQLFKKSETLYGLDQEIENLQNGYWPVIVEGPLDRLAICKTINTIQAENPDTVVPLSPLATCGTALTKAHIQAIKTYTKAPITLCYDADSPGEAATLRAWDEIIKKGYPWQDHRAIVLPEGLDPAELVKQHKTKQLIAKLYDPWPLSQYATLIRQKQGLPLSASVTDITVVPKKQRDGFISGLAATYNVEVQAVQAAFISQAGTDTPTSQNRTFAAPASSHATITMRQQLAYSPGIQR